MHTVLHLQAALHDAHGIGLKELFYLAGGVSFHFGIVFGDSDTQKYCTIYVRMNAWAGAMHDRCSILSQCCGNLRAASWSMQGCVVEWEGLKRKYWTFSVVNRSGMSLVRVSSSSASDAEAWVDVRPSSALLTISH